MFSKLAVRNVKRQVGNYLIYFITVALTVALLFSANQIIFNEKLTSYALKTEEFRAGLTGVVVFVSLIIAFVLSYAASFMLKLRKREFGVYLALGMTRKDILHIFIGETMVICLTALGVGMALGFFVYQGLMAVVLHLLEMHMEIAAYTLEGTVFTVGVVAGIFLVSTFVSSVYLKRVSIYELIHGAKKVEKKVRHPFVWVIVTVLSLSVMIVSCIVFYQGLEQAIVRGEGMATLVYALLCFGGSLVMFHMGLAKSGVFVMLRQKRFCSRGTAVFVLRQLSGTLGSNSMMMGTLAFLLTFAVIGSNFSFVQRASRESALNHDCPFDIMYSDRQNGEILLSSNSEMKDIMKKYVTVKNEFSYGIYTTGGTEFYERTELYAEGLFDSFMSLSEFNSLCEPLGYDSIQLQNEFFIAANREGILKGQWEDMEFQWNGKSYHYKGASNAYPAFSYLYFLVVVPDEAISAMQEEIRYRAYNVKERQYDVEGLSEELFYAMAGKYDGLDIYEAVDFRFKEMMRQSENSTSAMLVVGALVCSMVFLFMAMAILALKTLSGIWEDQKRYGILFRLGAGEREQRKTLFFQTFCFFVLPFGTAVLMSVPTAMISRRMISLSGLQAAAPRVQVIAGMIALVMTMIYFLYYTATYLIIRRAVVCVEKG